SGGVIEYNFANIGGGGVFVGSDGSFEMSGGVIANNSVKINGGGVLSYSDFTMTGGVIENNKADLGGGVAAESAFTMAGGKISNNFANIIGGGVLVNSDFTMTGGTISNNVANYGDGGGVLAHSDFTMAGGTIENNTANDGSGGGVFSFGSFTMMGGKISNNTADVYGGGVYIYEASFAMTGGTISDNTAFLDGGGVWITNTNENLSNFTIPADATGVVFSNNHASAAYDRDPADDGAYEMYITGEVTWSEPFTQGYNNYDISYAVGTALTFYTVSFDLNAGEDAVEGLISDSKPILFDKIYGKLPELSRDGCTFEGWFTAVSGGEKVDSSTVVTNEADHVLYAQWTKPAGGGNGGNKSSGSGFGQAGITENNENALNNSGSNKTTPPANKPSGSDSGRTQNIGTNSLPGALFWAMVLLTAPALAFGLILYRNRNQM
ncbi:MAG: InlB B-repeat-containing protein, partial [Methanimicrococcus sp.]|nr:InlB B-repeat-containing protein [Methanimicrococcus sp.]